VPGNTARYSVDPAKLLQADQYRPRCGTACGGSDDVSSQIQASYGFKSDPVSKAIEIAAGKKALGF
jgi:hypothetical protein